MNPSTPPKGSLEDLFRHHLLESEAAAVPPRPHVWEQLDNSLLLAQNEQYRRRLRVHRWAIAASLLLATLSGGGWWHSQQATPDLARATSTGAAGIGTASRPSARSADLTQQAASTSSLASASNGATGTSAKATYAVSSNSNPATIGQTSTSPSYSKKVTGTAATGYPAVAATTATNEASTRSASQTHTSPQGQHAVAGGRSASHLAKASRTAVLAASYTASTTKSDAAQAGLLAPAVRTSAASARPAAALATDQLAMAAANSASSLAADQAAHSAQQAVATEALNLRLAQLRVADSQDLPTALAALPVSEEPAPTVTRRWQFGVEYATTAFRPNIDFAKEASAYNPALGPMSAKLTQQAAAEYRSNLHTGLGQRIGVWTARRLGNGRLNLRMGLELAQNTATSATSAAFVGEQVPDLNYTMPARMQATSYRYRSASVPVELRYGNPLKSGFSFYSRLGGLLTALLNVRSEVEGNAEATRTYTLLSASSPYRHVSGSVRGAAGLQYRPSGHQWSLSLGPVAEAGIFSMNTDPAQDFWSQKRPYSFGLEAGVELGRSPRLLLK